MFLPLIDKMKQFAVSPDLGKCSKTGSWENIEEKDACLDCIKYGEDYFYCGGVGCVSRYDTGTTCSMNQLVAKNEAQCASPCYQEAAPPMGGCSDDYDCPGGKKCVKKFEPKHGGMFGKCAEGYSYGKQGRPAATYGI